MIFAAALSLEIDALGSDLFLLLMNIAFAVLHLSPRVLPKSLA